ncbi:hypothetical protein BZA05DRAFT_477417 [Tricharina praecox]|uniref:uncharacterized protein n=1 Tax=Tricharina praecox TaxID=43433 RepID=UPI00221FE817|nr:uncharacterized protein BZA05DRAFT_477417 [Tricharina praecox]KAI5842759.1 hypothetical protein BZA05DRAFT_477417 [Tricharina praecox]
MSEHRSSTPASPTDLVQIFLSACTLLVAIVGVTLEYARRRRRRRQLLAHNPTTNSNLESSVAVVEALAEYGDVTGGGTSTSAAAGEGEGEVARYIHRVLALCVLLWRLALALAMRIATGCGLGVDGWGGRRAVCILSWFGYGT